MGNSKKKKAAVKVLEVHEAASAIRLALLNKSDDTVDAEVLNQWHQIAVDKHGKGDVEAILKDIQALEVLTIQAMVFALHNNEDVILNREQYLPAIERLNQFCQRVGVVRDAVKAKEQPAPPAPPLPVVTPRSTLHRRRLAPHRAALGDALTKINAQLDRDVGAVTRVPFTRQEIPALAVAHEIFSLYEKAGYLVEFKGFGEDFGEYTVIIKLDW